MIEKWPSSTVSLMVRVRLTSWLYEEENLPTSKHVIDTLQYTAHERKKAL